ncbi:unnamed protein product [Amoebophrya sp. A25]|nr:unnamed protein product [Amoebophrya sp. A25]|eukprot:GSA25T00009235001.1
MAGEGDDLLPDGGNIHNHSLQLAHNSALSTLSLMLDEQSILDVAASLDIDNEHFMPTSASINKGATYEDNCPPPGTDKSLNENSILVKPEDAEAVVDEETDEKEGEDADAEGQLEALEEFRDRLVTELLQHEDKERQSQDTTGTAGEEAEEQEQGDNELSMLESKKATPSSEHRDDPSSRTRTYPSDWGIKDILAHLPYNGLLPPLKGRWQRPSKHFFHRTGEFLERLERERIEHATQKKQKKQKDALNASRKEEQALQGMDPFQQFLRGIALEELLRLRSEESLRADLASESKMFHKLYGGAGAAGNNPILDEETLFELRMYYNQSMLSAIEKRQKHVRQHDDRMIEESAEAIARSDFWREVQEEAVRQGKVKGSKKMLNRMQKEDYLSVIKSLNAVLNSSVAESKALTKMQGEKKSKRRLVQVDSSMKSKLQESFGGLAKGLRASLQQEGGDPMYNSTADNTFVSSSNTAQPVVETAAPAVEEEAASDAQAAESGNIIPSGTSKKKKMSSFSPSSSPKGGARGQAVPGDGGDTTSTEDGDSSEDEVGAALSRMEKEAQKRSAQVRSLGKNAATASARAASVGEDGSGGEKMSTSVWRKLRNARRLRSGAVMGGILFGGGAAGTGGGTSPTTSANASQMR